MMSRVNRRTVLRGLGGACVAAPFLGSLAGKAVSAQPPAPPKRLIVMFTHYGCITTRFFPARSHGPLSRADLEPTTLRHLAPFVDKLLLPRGIRAMNEWNTEMTRGQGNDPHLQVLGSFFTCQPVTPHADSPFVLDAATKFEAMPVGPSLDHVIAEQLSANGLPLYVRVGNRTETPASGVSYRAPRALYQGVGSLTEVYTTLTGLFPAGEPVSPDSYRAARGKSILDLVRDDLDSLARHDMSQADRHKLEAWKALLHDTGGMIGSAACNPEAAAALGVTQPQIIAAEAAQRESGLDAKVTAQLDVADVYANLAVLAALCNVSPVVVLKYPSSYVYKGLGLTTDVGSLSHRIGNASLTGTCLTGVLEMLHSIDDYHARKFAHLLTLLDGIDEGDSTVLDNTAAIWFQEMSDGLAHNLNNLPIVQAGSLGGFFKTGRAVNVEDGSPELTAGNSELFCRDGASDSVDARPQSTGTDPRLANAPINKYYVSLMNALDVKAGEDGFPDKNGTAVVTKFGRYDRTEDFVGGTAVPPAIHDPGGFEELEAG